MILDEVKTERLPLGSIVVDQRFQLRVAGVNPEVQEDYAEFLRNGVELPPLVVFRDGDTHRLVDGFHRIKALQQVEAEEAICEIREGDEQAALDYTLFEANRKNGVRLTRKDQQNLVRRACEDARFVQVPSNTLAELLGVAPQTVRKAREELGLKVPTMQWYDSEPPSGPELPNQGGFPDLTKKVAVRLVERLEGLEASLAKLEPLSDYLDEHEAHALIGISERVAHLAEGAL